ncbi:MAG: hypothetical protein J6M47_02725 [Clostridia bacterium]|nr:hypothetical protein [Clostridia bacterium]
MEKKVFIIFMDDPENYGYLPSMIKGYIHGTEEEAAAYCDELNKGVKHYYDKYTFDELDCLNPQRQ